MSRIILFVICMLMSVFGVVGCHTTQGNGDQSTESGFEQSEVSVQSEEISESVSENVSEEESSVSEEESKLVDYSSGGGIVLPDDEW